MNPVKDITKALKVLEGLKFTVIDPVEPVRKIASKLFEIGKIQRMVVECDYPVGDNALDVICKRTMRSVPTFAFSVNLEGGFDKPIQTLKHAHDLWNSRPFLITQESRMNELKDFISGLYHEFESALKILDVTQIRELYGSKRHYL